MKMIDLLNAQIPTDHSAQVHANQYIDRLVGRGAPRQRVLDLGCGGGESRGAFAAADPALHWVGIDVATSPEVDQRRAPVVGMTTFDGVHIPFPDHTFDLIYSHQVFEHVRHPAPLLHEVSRTLKPGGLFAGSTSHLEPYHSHSLWNYTPYGFVVLLNEARLEALELRPGIDALTLLARRVLGRPPLFGRWFIGQSPGNRLIDLLGRARRLSPRQINAIKLLLCGQFCFLARKPHPTFRPEPSSSTVR